MGTCYQNWTVHDFLKFPESEFDDNNKRFQFYAYLMLCLVDLLWISQALHCFMAVKRYALTGVP